MQRILSIILFSLWTAGIFSAGYFLGARETFQALNSELQKQIEELAKSEAAPGPTPFTQTKILDQIPTPAPQPQKTTYTGPQLWEAVNGARIEHGVSALGQRDILCTIAAIRLAQIRELGKLDGHDGFKGVYEKYKDDPNMPNNVSEFLISGYPTPGEAVSGWLDTLGHKKLITGGEYVWGCIYAQEGFGVAITGY